MIKLIGTSHIARQAIKRVRQVILKEKPQIVCVELDHARFRSLMKGKKRALSIRDIREMGTFGFLFALIGQWLQEKLGNQVGVNPGADMKEAVLAAREVRAKVYLVDQPIQRTLVNLSKKVSIWEKVRLVFYIILSPLYPENKKTLKKLKLDEVPPEQLVDELLAALKGKFPNIYQVLVEDRNRHIANATKLIHKKSPDSDIILVVGAGHLSGVKALLKK